MRELTFRAWDGEEMWTGFHILESTIIVPPAYTKSVDLNLQFMQFTGLKDKNGVEIYEKDIVEVAWGKGETFHKGKVIFYNAQFQVEVQGSKTALSHFGQKWVEVIGNIWEPAEEIVKYIAEVDLDKTPVEKIIKRINSMSDYQNKRDDILKLIKSGDLQLTGNAEQAIDSLVAEEVRKARINEL